AQPGLAGDDEGDEGAHHVLGAVREIDDVEQTEDHGEPEREQRIERPVDQADQQLPEQRLRRDAEDLGHVFSSTMTATGCNLRPFQDGTPGRPESWRAPCSSRTGPWIRRASSLPRDTPGAACGRPCGCCPCRTAGRPSASPSSARSPWCRRRSSTLPPPSGSA